MFNRKLAVIRTAKIQSHGPWITDKRRHIRSYGLIQSRRELCRSAGGPDNRCKVGRNFDYCRKALSRTHAHRIRLTNVHGVRLCGSRTTLSVRRLSCAARKSSLKNIVKLVQEWTASPNAVRSLARASSSYGVNIKKIQLNSRKSNIICSSKYCQCVIYNNDSSMIS